MSQRCSGFPEYSAGSSLPDCALVHIPLFCSFGSFYISHDVLLVVVVVGAYYCLRWFPSLKEYSMFEFMLEQYGFQKISSSREFLNGKSLII